MLNDSVGSFTTQSDWCLIRVTTWCVKQAMIVRCSRQGKTVFFVVSLLSSSTTVKVYEFVVVTRNGRV